PMTSNILRAASAVVSLVVLFDAAAGAEMPWVRVSDDQKGFTLDPSGKAFAPWGFNYDHDPKGRLIEDYWEDEWARVEADFAQMKKLGANVVRVHLQFGKFMDGPDRPNEKALDRLGKLLALTEREGLYLDLTGLGCYHKADVPAWYDTLAEADRWDAQARFWVAVAGRCKDSPAVFCYDLMNEPVVPGGKRQDGDWLAPPFAGKHFVQFITLDQKDRPRPEIARAWVRHLSAAVRKIDRRHPVTVGLVDWSLDRKGITSGFVPEKVAPDLDFLAVHLYPESGKLDAGLETLKGFAVGKPVVVEETFPLRCSPKELDEFIDRAGPLAAGWVSFYWGKPPEELRKSKDVTDAIVLDWLGRFEKRAKMLPR
ncbi:MAG TPA: cellulase family glycosylhydrolase, partial [Gemmataceae bacterium]|nr:cellulase family glycosylhydrolase [Gemmataceae bacterium]